VAERRWDDCGQRTRRVLDCEVAVRHVAVDDLRRVAVENVQIAALRYDAHGGHERGRQAEDDKGDRGGEAKARRHDRKR